MENNTAGMGAMTSLCSKCVWCRGGVGTDVAPLPASRKGCCDDVGRMCCDIVGMGAVTELNGKAFKKQLQTGWVL